MWNNNLMYRTPYQQPIKQQFTALPVPSSAPNNCIDLSKEDPMKNFTNMQDNSEKTRRTMENPCCYGQYWNCGQLNLMQGDFINEELSPNALPQQPATENGTELNSTSRDKDPLSNIHNQNFDDFDFSIPSELDSSLSNASSSHLGIERNSHLIQSPRDGKQLNMKIIKNKYLALKTTIKEQNKTIAELNAQLANERQLSMFRTEELKQRSDKQHQSFLRKINEWGKKLTEMQTKTNENHIRKFAQWERLLAKRNQNMDPSMECQSNNPFANWSCSICLESEGSTEDHPIVSLPCGHIFHKNCIEECLWTSNKCPYCRKILRSSDLTNLYLSS